MSHRSFDGAAKEPRSPWKFVAPSEPVPMQAAGRDQPIRWQAGQPHSPDKLLFARVVIENRFDSPPIPTP